MSDTSAGARALELRILNCGLPAYLKKLLHLMYREGDWDTGTRIRVSNATLAKQLSLKKTRRIQINIGILMHMKILEAVGPLLPTRQRNGHIDRTVLTARRGGRVPTEFRINFGALPPPTPMPAEGRSVDHGRRDPDDSQGRSSDHPRGDPPITRSSPRPPDRPSVRAATADAAAFPELGPLKTAPKIDCGRMPPSTTQRLVRDRSASGNYRVLQVLAWTVLKEPRRQLRYIQELVKSESDLVAAVKVFAAGKRIAVEGDEVYRACASVWLKFRIPGIVTGTEARLRDRARRHVGAAEVLRRRQSR